MYLSVPYYYQTEGYESILILIILDKTLNFTGHKLTRIEIKCSNSLFFFTEDLLTICRISYEKI